MTDRPLLTVILSGPFTTSDLTAMLKVVRFIDRHDPEGRYAVAIEDPSGAITVADAEDMMRGAFSADTDRATKISVIRKQ